MEFVDEMELTVWRIYLFGEDTLRWGRYAGIGVLEEAEGRVSGGGWWNCSRRLLDQAEAG